MIGGAPSGRMAAAAPVATPRLTPRGADLLPRAPSYNSMPSARGAASIIAAGNGHGRTSGFTANLVGRFYSMNTMEKEVAVERAAVARKQRDAARRAFLEAKWEREQARLADLAERKRQLEIEREKKRERQRKREWRKLQNMAAAYIQMHVRGWLPRLRSTRVARVQRCWRKMRRRQAWQRFLFGLDAIRERCVRYKYRLEYHRYRAFVATCHTHATIQASSVVEAALARTSRRVAAAWVLQRAWRCYKARGELWKRQNKMQWGIWAVTKLQGHCRRARAKRVFLILQREHLAMLMRKLADERERERLRQLAEDAARKAAEEAERELQEDKLPPKPQRVQLSVDERRRCVQLMKSYQARHWQTYEFRQEQLVKSSADALVRRDVLAELGRAKLAEGALAQELHSAIGDTLDLLMDNGLGFTENEVALMRECRRLGRGVLGMTSQRDDEHVLKEMMRIVFELDNRSRRYQELYEAQVQEWRDERARRKKRCAEQRRLRELIELNRRVKEDTAAVERERAKKEWIDRQIEAQRNRARKAARRRQQEAILAEERRWEVEIEKAEQEAYRRQMRERWDREHSKEMQKIVARSKARRALKDTQQRELEQMREEERRQRRAEAHARGQERCKQFLKEYREKQEAAKAGDKGDGVNGDDTQSLPASSSSISPMHESLTKQTQAAAGGGAKAVMALARKPRVPRAPRRRVIKRKKKAARRRSTGDVEGVEAAVAAAAAGDRPSTAADVLGDGAGDYEDDYEPEEVNLDGLHIGADAAAERIAENAVASARVRPAQSSRKSSRGARRPRSADDVDAAVDLPPPLSPLMPNPYDVLKRSRVDAMVHPEPALRAEDMSSPLLSPIRRSPEGPEHDSPDADEGLLQMGAPSVDSQGGIVDSFTRGVEEASQIPYVSTMTSQAILAAVASQKVAAKKKRSKKKRKGGAKGGAAPGQDFAAPTFGGKRPEMPKMLRDLPVSRVSAVRLAQSRNGAPPQAPQSARGPVNPAGVDAVNAKALLRGFAPPAPPSGQRARPRSAGFSDQAAAGALRNPRLHGPTGLDDMIGTGRSGGAAAAAAGAAPPCLEENPDASNADTAGALLEYAMSISSSAFLKQYGLLRDPAAGGVASPIPEGTDEDGELDTDDLQLLGGGLGLSRSQSSVALLPPGHGRYQPPQYGAEEEKFDLDVARIVGHEVARV